LFEVQMAEQFPENVSRLLDVILLTHLPSVLLSLQYTLG
jgi:hypothetical protein